MNIYLCPLLIFTGLLSADVLFHTVKPGESLSEILYTYDLEPIYPNDGSLKNTLSINAALLKSSGNLIFPGQIIKIDTSHNAKLIKDSKAQERKLESSQPTQTNEKARHKPSLYKDRNTLSIGLLSGYLGVLGKDQSANTGEILSNLYFGIGGEYQTNLSKKYSLGLQASYIDLSIEDTIGSELLNRDQGLKSVGAFISRNLPWVKLRFGFNLADQILYQSETSNSYKVLSVLNNQAYLGLERGLYSSDNTSLDLGLGLSFNSFTAPSGVDLSPGTGYCAYLNYRKEKASQALAISLRYDIISFRTFSTDMAFRSLSLGFDYEFEFFTGE